MELRLCFDLGIGKAFLEGREVILHSIQCDNEINPLPFLALHKSLPISKIQKQTQERMFKEENRPYYSETLPQLHLPHSSLHCMLVLFQQKEGQMQMEYHENQQMKHLKYKFKKTKKVFTFLRTSQTRQPTYKQSMYQQEVII